MPDKEFIVSKKPESFFISRRDMNRLIVDKVTGVRLALTVCPDWELFIHKSGKLHVITDLISGSRVSEHVDRVKAIRMLLGFISSRFGNDPKLLQDHLEGLWENRKAECAKIRGSYAMLIPPELPAVKISTVEDSSGPYQEACNPEPEPELISTSQVADNVEISVEGPVAPSETNEALPHQVGYIWGKMVMARLRKRGVRKVGKWAFRLFKACDKRPNKSAFYASAAYAVAQYR